MAKKKGTNKNNPATQNNTVSQIQTQTEEQNNIIKNEEVLSPVVSEKYDKAVKLTREKVTIHELINFDKEPSEPVKVSIVMPVCNVEQYLRECLDSCVNQTLKEIEIICVNDGSTDSCLDILKEYAAKDDRVKVIDKDNAGYGHTMNIGMDMARGEYIGIVESDDFVELNMYEELYKVAKENELDLVKADFNRFKVINGYYSREYFSISKDPSLYNKIIDLTDCIDAYKIVMNTWSGIYKRDYLIANNIRHNETPGASYQDNGFWFQTFAYAKRGYFVDKPYYMNRRDNPNSSVYSKSKVFCMCDEYRYIRQIIDKDYEHNQHLIPIYHLRKFHNYKFNYTRVAPEYKLDFLKVFHDEFKQASENGELDKSLFTEKEWKDLQDIIRDDYVEFNSKFYWEKLMWNREKVLELQNKIEEMQVPEKPDISIIVPVYNTAQYLKKCLDSLVNQTHKNIEIICVNDGSTDSSPIILNDFSIGDSRVRIIHQENQGVSHARNAGIEASNGQYILFVDADDYIEKNTCKKLLDTVKQSNADIVIFGGSTTTKVKWIDERLTTKAAIYENDSTHCMFDCAPIKPFCFNKLYSSSLIKKNNIFFDEEMDLGEDQLWLFSLVPWAKKIQVIEDKLYHYVTEREGSAMETYSADPDTKALKHLQLINKIYDEWETNKFISQNELQFFEWMVVFVCRSLSGASLQIQKQICSEFFTKYELLFEACENSVCDLEAKKSISHMRDIINFDYDKPIISIIIPVYNSEKYLKQCIDSIIGQTFLQFEVIAVDDGSKDNSLDILREFSQKDKRIKVYTQQNLFAGVARNNGMKHAAGQYLLFLDSDDFFDPHMLEKMYERITTTDSDICICSGRNYHTDTNKYVSVHSLLNKKLLPDSEFFSPKDVNIYNLTSSVVWNKMFKKSFVYNNKLQFSPTRTANDVFFVNRALAYAERITYTCSELVNYRVGMTTNLQSVKKDVPLDFYYEFLKVKDELVERGIYDELKRTYSSMVFSNFLYHLQTISSGEGFIKVYNVLVNEAVNDFDLNLAQYDDNYFVLDFLNKEYKKIDFNILSAEDLLLYKYRENTNQIVDLNKRLKSAKTQNDEISKKLDWNRKQVELLKKELNTAIQSNTNKSESKTNLENQLSAAYRELDDIRNSKSFKAGRMITWLPRKIRDLFRKNK